MGLPVECCRFRLDYLNNPKLIYEDINVLQSIVESFGSEFIVENIHSHGPAGPWTTWVKINFRTGAYTGSLTLRGCKITAVSWIKNGNGRAVEIGVGDQWIKIRGHKSFDRAVRLMEKREMKARDRMHRGKGVLPAQRRSPNDVDQSSID